MHWGRGRNYTCTACFVCAQVCLLGIGPPVISHTKFSDLSESSEDPLAIVSVSCVVTVMCCDCHGEHLDNREAFQGGSHAWPAAF